jgi:hypothetical protein
MRMKRFMIPVAIVGFLGAFSPRAALADPVIQVLNTMSSTIEIDTSPACAPAGQFFGVYVTDSGQTEAVNCKTDMFARYGTAMGFFLRNKAKTELCGFELLDGKLQRLKGPTFCTFNLSGPQPWHIIVGK